MSKTALRVDYKKYQITSKFIERTDEGLSILKELCENAVKGNIDFLEIVTNYGTCYMSRDVLKKSVITIVNNDCDL